MKIVDYFGFKISGNCNDKSDRACYKFAKNDTIIYDKSYQYIYILKCANEDFWKQLFSQHLVNGEPSRFSRI